MIGDVIQRVAADGQEPLSESVTFEIAEDISIDEDVAEPNRSFPTGAL